MCFVLILSGLYTLRYEVQDPILNNEEILFAETLENKFDGKILDAGYTLKGMHYVHVTDPLGVFKNYKISQDPGAYYLFEFNSENINLMPTKLYAKSLEDFIEVSYEYELNYISINKNGVEDIFYPYLDEIYENEEKFPYLRKVFDTEKEGFEKFKTKFGLSDYDANILTDEKGIALYFNELCSFTNHFKAAANFVNGSVKSYMNENAITIQDFNINPQQLSTLIDLVDAGKISNTIATSKVFPEMLNSNKTAAEIAGDNNWIQESDSDALGDYIRQAIAKYPEKIQEYKDGKKGLIGLFMGEVMKLSKGKADPKLCNQMLREILEK